MNIEDEVRKKILEFLYSQYRDRPRANIAKGQVATALRVYDRNQVDRNITFLKDEGFVTFYKVKLPMKPLFETDYIRITSKGVKLFEEPSTFVREYPRERKYLGYVENLTINAQGQRGIIAVGENISAEQSINIGDSLKKLEEGIKGSSMPVTDKNLALEQVGQISNELSKDQPDKTLLQKALGILSVSADIATIAPGLAEVARYIYQNVR